jgi:hypothetical protein
MDLHHIAVVELTGAGWSDEAIFRFPAPLMADWFRERGHEAIADALASPTDMCANNIRDQIWLNASDSTRQALLPYIRSVREQMEQAIGGDHL